MGDDEIDLLVSFDYAVSTVASLMINAQTGQSDVEKVRLKNPEVAVLVWMLPDCGEAFSEKWIPRHRSATISHESMPA